MEVKALFLNLPAPVPLKGSFSAQEAVSSSRGAFAIENPASVLKENASLRSFLSVSERAILNAINHINDILTSTDIGISFSIHQATKTRMIKLINIQTEEIIKEIPPERLLDVFADRMKLLGLLFDERR